MVKTSHDLTVKEKNDLEWATQAAETAIADLNSKMHDIGLTGEHRCLGSLAYNIVWALAADFEHPYNRPEDILKRAQELTDSSAA